jgi:hypothetical protein
MDFTDLEVEVSTSKIRFYSTNEESFEKAKKILKKIGYPSIDENSTVIDKAKSYISCAVGKIEN